MYYLDIHKNESALRKLCKFHVLKALELRYCLHVVIVDVHLSRDRDTAVKWDEVRHNMLLLLHIIARSKSGMFLLIWN